MSVTILGRGDDTPSPWPPYDRWVGATVDLEAIIATSSKAELCIGSFTVFPNSWLFELSLTTTSDREILERALFWPAGGVSSDGGFRFGLRFPDGTRALPMDESGLISLVDSHGSGTTHRQVCLVNQAPMAGEAILVYEFPLADIDRDEWRLDGTVLAFATDRCIVLQEYPRVE